MGDIWLIRIRILDQDIELGLHPNPSLSPSDDIPATIQRLSPLSASIRDIEDDRNRVHRVIGDALELFAGHLRPSQGV